MKSSKPSIKTGSPKQNPMRAAGLALLTAAAAASLSGCTGSPQTSGVIKVESADSLSNLITVTGSETVKIVPDMAQIDYAIYTREDTAAKCQEKNSADLAAAIETLKGLGVEEASIQTTAYGLNPIYDWKSGDQKITGYEMNSRLTISDIPIDKTGTILSQSVAAGVNSIDSVSYFSSNYDASYQEALKGAVAVARAKAEALAQAGGKSIGEVSHMEEYGYNPSVRYSAYQASPKESMARNETMDAGADVSVMPGEVSVKAEVRVDFKLAD